MARVTAARPNGTRRNAVFWFLAFSALGAGILARNLIGLDRVPPGMYVDEASIGYNAWAIAYHGVDEHGFHLPLYFQAFSEYKNPVYVYALVPLLRFLSLTPAVERTPAVLFGLVAALFITLAAFRLSRSHAIALFLLALAALTPWLIQESRVGFEVIAMVATLTAAVWCLADDVRLSGLRFATAGVFFAISVFAYSSARLEVLVFAAAVILVYRHRRGWWLSLIPIGAAYGVLGLWSLSHPGALTAEFAVVNIGADHAAIPTLAARFFSNYIQYFSPDFLFIHGDPNLRHNTGYAGMLPAVMAPLLLVGLWACWRLREKAFPRFVALGLMLAPVAGALTYPAPHALRGATMLPFLFALATYGLMGIRDLTRGGRLVPVALVAALAAQGTLYTLDMYTAYPARAAAAFDTGAVPAVITAVRAAAGHEVFLSSTLNEEPYIDAFVALLPPPPSLPTADSTGRGLAILGMAVADPAAALRMAHPGDVVVLAAGDAPPGSGAELIDTERAPPNPLAPQPSTPALVLVYLLA